MHRMRWVGTSLAVVLSLGVGACSGSPPASTPAPAPTTTTATAELTPAPTPMPSVTAEPTASALADLAAFIDAAREVDLRLHAATPLINATITTDTVVVDEATASAVRAIDLSAVASTIPAGMPPELMRQVLTAYSDLVSRTLAVSRFRYADRTYSRVPADGAMGPAEGEEMVACLANGSPAAHRFDADLAAVVSTAAATTPLPTLEPTSLAHPELQARLQEIVTRNGGCGACGGYVTTRSSSIVWDDAEPSATTRNGTIVDEPDGAGTDDGGISFTATYSPGIGWTVDIHAC
ncbi:MAG TPA: hypothetical protein VFW79_13290 [Cellulomonas sp.]|uniref:hypothetical protein n=1 Tax=Cellulomonas sp. TaxID=40001 RepID=UPI002E36BFA8|nr:hypothetical protein [Cellulomonas sp.]HEX5333611.1 hypothetical protein [Cellulomonas sp.]